MTVVGAVSEAEEEAATTNNYECPVRAGIYPHRFLSALLERREVPLAFFYFKHLKLELHIPILQ